MTAMFRRGIFVALMLVLLGLCLLFPYVARAHDKTKPTPTPSTDTTVVVNHSGFKWGKAILAGVVGGAVVYGGIKLYESQDGRKKLVAEPIGDGAKLTARLEF